MTDSKSVLITGASGVIGGAIAKRLGQVGFNLALAGRKAKPYTMDLKDPLSCSKVCQDFFSEMKNPFALVSAAGNLGTPGRFMEVDFPSWRNGFEENFISQAALIHSFAREASARKIKDARVIVFSGAGVGGKGSFANVTSYGAAKAALVHLTEALAEEFLPLGIAINAIAPGAVLSGITDQAISAGEDRIGAYASSAMECRKSGGVSPDLAADLVEFLLSAKATGISGRLLSARFDQKVLAGQMDEVIKDSNRYRLRRIDNDLFMPAEKGK